MIIQMTGMSGAGKSTLAKEIKKMFNHVDKECEIIDGDEYRKGINLGLGFTKDDRIENLRRLSHIAKILNKYHISSIIATINPYNYTRKMIDDICGGTKLIYVKCDLETLKLRDTKGFYKNNPTNFTGISDPFEEPENCSLILDTSKETLRECCLKIEKLIYNL